MNAPFNWDDWRIEYCNEADPEIPNQHCQREKDHGGPHKSYTRTCRRQRLHTPSFCGGYIGQEGVKVMNAPFEKFWVYRKEESGHFEVVVSPLFDGPTDIQSKAFIEAAIREKLERERP